MDQDKLSKLELLCIENDFTDKLTYEDLITNFAKRRKERKLLVKKTR